MKRKSTAYELPLQLGRNFAVLSRLYFCTLNKKLEELDIDRYFGVLLLLEQASKTCTQKYIADQLMIDKATMVRVLDHLFNKGYITRTKNMADRRAHTITLTPKAKKIMPKIKKATKDLNEQLFYGLSKEKTKIFFEGLENVNKKLGYKLECMNENCEKQKQKKNLKDEKN